MTMLISKRQYIKHGIKALNPISSFRNPKSKPIFAHARKNPHS
jgi:hypothetical protein